MLGSNRKNKNNEKGVAMTAFTFKSGLHTAAILLSALSFAACIEIPSTDIATENIFADYYVSVNGEQNTVVGASYYTYGEEVADKNFLFLPALSVFLKYCWH